MIPLSNLSKEELLSQVQMTQDELKKIQKESWEKTKAVIIETLENDGLFVTPDSINAYLKTLEFSWNRGYAAGSADTTEYLIRKFWGESTVQTLKLYKKILSTDSENN